MTPSRSFQSFPRSQDNSFSSGTIRTPTAVNRPSLALSDSFSQHSSNSSSQSPSTSSTNATPIATNRTSKQHYQRPSTLHGLKHKLHSSACPKALHAASPSCTTAVPNRRKSVGHIPLSPLARTPSPSPLPASPTRSPSPLAFPVGHQPGSSNTTQSYSPSAGTAPIACNQSKKGFVRPKGAEPGSPLLRRALSPDRLHPRSAESKCSISPLCSSGNSPPVKVQTRSGSVWRPNPQPDKDKEVETEVVTSQVEVATSAANNDSRLSLNLSGPGELLPRIAEEKDSPTNNGQDDKDKKCDKSGENKSKNVQQKDKKEKKCDKNGESCNKEEKFKKCDKTTECHKSTDEKKETKKCDKGDGSKMDDKTKKSDKSQSCDSSKNNTSGVKAKDKSVQ